MPTRSAVMVDMDMYELAKVRALELNTSFSQLTVNALERYYGLPETDYKSRYFNPNGDKAGRKIKHRHINPKIRRNMRARTIRKLKAEKEVALERVSQELSEYKSGNERLHEMLRDERLKYSRLETENIRLDKLIHSQGKDLQYLNSEIKTYRTEIELLQQKGWHLQGVIEGLQHVIGLLIKHPKG